MKKILLILTGGTIGSTEQNGIIFTDTMGKNRAVERYHQKYGDVIFTLQQPLNILSENLSVNHWEVIVNHIRSLDLSEYDGMIITHGSDTLSYSSAMLAFCLCGLRLPVVITAANYVPDDSRSNALDNLRAAVIMINTTKNGIFTVYKNDGEDFCTVFMPTRLREADRFLDRFSSIDGHCIGTVQNDRFTPDRHAPTLDEISAKNQPILTDKLILKSNVLMIRPYPSLNYDSIALPNGTRAVLHITYHSATASAEAENSALTFLKTCSNKKIDFYLASFKKANTAVYETGNRLIQNGAVPLYGISDESAYAKLLLAYHTDTKNSKDFMRQDLYFEQI